MLTVNYVYSPDGRIVSRTGTVKPEGGSAVAIGRDEIDEWLDNYEAGVVPAGPPVGTFRLLKALRFMQEPGLEPVCLECFIPPIRWVKIGLDIATSGQCKSAGLAEFDAIPPGRVVSEYVVITAGKSVRNIQTDVSRAEFEANLIANGYTRRVVDAEKNVVLYSKDNVSYSVRDNARSTGTSTADYRRGDESNSVKIRLK